MLKIGVICAYFGKFPVYYDTWLKSCEYNKTIDFLLITDQPVKTDVENVHVINISFEDMKKLADETLEVHVSLNYPYKLCDLRPMYGIIFAKYLKEYDYWGHCDMDVIFGDIRAFTDKYELVKYDKFLRLGHLGLYRNTQENNYRFKLGGSSCGSWLKIIKDSDGHAFDETPGIYCIFKKNGFPVFDEMIFADISYVHHRFTIFLDKNYENQIFYWENGKAFRDYWEGGQKKTQEFIYIHTQKRGFSRPDFDLDNATAFYVGPNGYAEKTQQSKLSDVAIINPCPGTGLEKKEEKKYKRKHLIERIKRKLRRMFKKRW